jgi:putative membrane protein
MSRFPPALKPLAAAVASLVFCLGAHAAGNLSRGDTKFLQEAAADNMAEIDLGKLAQEKAMHEEVKSFAKRMVEDHGKALEELKAVASANGVTLPGEPDRKAQTHRARLEKLSGGDFDRAYMKRMVSDHRQDVHEFKEHASSKKESDAKTFAAKTLPTLVTHLESALATNDIAQDAKRSGKRETGSKKE